MKRPEDIVEIYLTPGEFFFGDGETRVRTLLGDGGVVFFWHKQKQMGGVFHFSEPKRTNMSTQLNPKYLDEAVSIAQLDMSRQNISPHEYVAKIFLHDDDKSAANLDAARNLMKHYNIKVVVEHVGTGNLVIDFWSGEVWLKKANPAVEKPSASPQDVLEIYLNPGEWYFGDEDTRIKTLLGSCVSFTLWHPTRKIGGMCHYMLPERGVPRTSSDLDGRYADEALELLVAEIHKNNTMPQEYIAKVFGGGSMLEQGMMNISGKNIDAARKLVDKYGFQMEGECMGGVGYRNIVFDVWNGHVWLKKNDRTQ
jgi:chemotaxis protein CheD